MIGTMMLGAWYSFFTDSRFLHNSIAQWLGLLAVMLGAFVAGQVAAFFLDRQATRREEREREGALSMLLRCMVRPVKLLALAAGLTVAGNFLTFPPSLTFPPRIYLFWHQVCNMIAVLAAGWFVYRLVDVLEFYLVRWTSKTETALDDQLVPLVRKTMRVFVVVVAALFIAQNIFQWDIGALIAGLGIGGLAFALAAKDMLANLFGSITIFADRPFQIGERIKVNGYDGTVEEVGFRSTRLRARNGHLVTIPNATIANEAVENVSSRPFFKRVLNVTITYDTPPDKVARAVEIIREMLDVRMEHFLEDSPPHAYFSDFNAASLNIIVYYWFAPAQWWDYMAFNHDFNMELLQRYNDEGIEFAFPTQTIYVKHDSGLKADVRIQTHGQDE